MMMSGGPLRLSLGSAIGLPLGEHGFRFFASAGSPIHGDASIMIPSIVLRRSSAAAAAEPSRPHISSSPCSFFSGRGEKGEPLLFVWWSELGGLACPMPDDWNLFWFDGGIDVSMGCQCLSSVFRVHAAHHFADATRRGRGVDRCGGETRGLRLLVRLSRVFAEDQH